MKKKTFLLTLFLSFILVTPIFGYNDIRIWINALQQREQAVQRGNTQEAIRQTINSLNYSGNASVNQAGDLIFLSMLCWNIRQKNNAIAAAEKAIQIMRNDRNLGNGCEARARIFLTKMKQNKLPPQFTPRDLLRSSGVFSYIMEIPNALFHKKMAQVTARYEALGAFADSQRKSYQMQGEAQARTARFYAKQEYWNETRESFDPTRRPSYRGQKQDAWDSCKKIHDIFQ